MVTNKRSIRLVYKDNKQQPIDTVVEVGKPIIVLVGHGPWKHPQRGTLLEIIEDNKVLVQLAHGKPLKFNKDRLRKAE